MPTPSAQLIARAERVRGFNRSYTRRIGVLQDRMLGGDYSLTELRVLYEISVRAGVQASDLCRELGVTAGYLSRVIARLERQRLIEKRPSDDDGRARVLSLTPMGEDEFRRSDAASRDEVMTLLASLSETGQQDLLEAMGRIDALLGESDRSYVLRDPRPGDMGWVVHRQAQLYASEHGWNSEFEALLAEIVAAYLRHYDPASDRCWIAEKDGAMVGSVFVVRQDERTAKLRMLYVDAAARGLGIGRRLVEESLRFARSAGYQRMELWTNSALLDAVRLYEKTGFVLQEEQHHHEFGKQQVSQVWSRAL